MEGLAVVLLCVGEVKGELHAEETRPINHLEVWRFSVYPPTLLTKLAHGIIQTHQSMTG